MQYTAPSYMVCKDVGDTGEIVAPGIMLIIAVVVIAGLVVKSCQPDPEQPPTPDP